jgi:hypothetical protein
MARSREILRNPRNKGLVLGKLFSKVRSFFSADKIVRGKVVEKDHYLPQPAGFDVVTMGVGKGQFMVQTPVNSPIESWSLTVERVDKRGNKLKEEIYVTWDVWSSATVGDKYP